MAEMRGLAELLENLKALGRNINSEARIAAAAGATLMKKEAVLIARAHGLVDTGALVKNIAIKRERGTSKTWHEYHIGVRHGREARAAERVAVRSKDGKIHFQWTNNPFYWWFWEFGHYNGFLKRHVAAKPFIRPAMETKQGEVLNAIRDRLAARLNTFQAKALSGN